VNEEDGRPVGRLFRGWLYSLAGRQLRLPQGLVANGSSTYQQLEFRRKSSDISNNILEVWWMATLVLGLSRAGCEVQTYGQRLVWKLLESFNKNGI